MQHTDQFPTNAQKSLFLLSVAYFILGMSTLSIIGLTAPISDALSTTPEATAQLVTVFALVYALTAPLLQAFFGHLPLRTLMIVGLLVMATGAFWSGLASSFGELFVARLIMALGGAVVGPVASVTGSALVANHDKGRALAIVFAGMTIATVLGVPVSSYLGEVIGWRPVMFTIAGAAVLIAIGGATALPKTLAGQTSSTRRLLAVLGNRTLLLALSITFLQMTAQFATYALIGAFLVAAGSLSSSMLPIALAVFGIGGVIGNTLAMKLIGPIGVERIIFYSLALLTVSFGLILAVAASDTATLAVLAIWAASGTLMMAPQQARLLELEPSVSGLLLALNASALYLGMAAGSAVAGVHSAVLGPGTLPLSSIAFCVLATIAFAASTKRAGNR